MTKQQLPKGWEMVKFGDIAKHISKRVEPSETDLEIYVGLEHLDPDSLKIKRHGVPGDVEGQKLLVKKGQIIFCKRRAYQRKVAVADWDCICSTDAMILEANPDNVIPEFLPFFMQSDEFVNRVIAHSEGSLSPRIKWKILAEQEFEIPCLEQQNKIVIASRKASIVVESIEQALLSLEKLKNQSLNNYCISYAPKKLKDFGVSLIDGDRGKAYPKTKDFKDDGYCLFLNAKNVTQVGFIFKEKQFIGKEQDKMLRKGKLIEGDIVITTRGTVGNVGLYCSCQFKHVRINSGMAILRCNDSELNNTFLYDFLRTKLARSLIVSKAFGSAQPQLTLKILENIEVPYLPSHKQIEFSNLYKKFDDIKQTLLAKKRNVFSFLKSIGNV
uniref:restriction endonuclease subunit S n=1 Tax=Snodgrassella alvi TaxID=1196083 RepID=UPI0015E88437|nr:restriction endonuclease subunit S [Snodgrassella alvi]